MIKIAKPGAPLETATAAVALEIKRAPEQIVNIAPDGQFEGYASLFGMVDMGRDLVAPGAFREFSHGAAPRA